MQVRPTSSHHSPVVHWRHVGRRTFAVPFALRYLLACCCLLPLASAQTFTVKDFATGARPVEAEPGDFNHDGKRDLVFRTDSTNSVYVHLSTGSGFGVRSEYEVASIPNDLRVADINDDGNTDIVVACAASGRISLLLGNGSGDFTRKDITFAEGTFSYALSVGDYNNDGRRDIAVTDGTQVWLMVNTGNATFTRKDLTVNRYPQEEGPNFSQLATGDFNKDGRDDLVVSDCCHRYYGDLYLLESDSSGGFASRHIDGRSSSYITAADMNNDGRLDVVSLFKPLCEHCDPYSGTVDVSYQDSGGNFTRKEVVTATSDWDGPHDITIADLNKDGRKDLAMANEPYFESANKQDAVLYWLQNSTGTFGSQQEVLIGEETFPIDITTADFDGNARADLAVTKLATDQFAVLYNASGTSTCSAPSTSTGLHVCSPASGSTVNSLVNIVAKGGSAINWMEVWIDGVKRYSASGNSVNTSISLGAGSHTMNVYAKQSGVVKEKQSVTFTVSGSTSTCSRPDSYYGAHICSPAAAATVSNPVHVIAAGGASVTSMEAWIDGVKKNFTATANMDFTVTLSTGTHTLNVYAKTSGTVTDKKTVTFTVN